MSNFFSRLSYSFGNEDWKTEHKALKIASGDRVLCITASGDRPLHLLMDDCASLISVDLNPIQNHLMNLKVTAMRHLPFEDYLSFLGAREASKEQRLSLFYKIQDSLPLDARNFWLGNMKGIASGILYQGAVEKLLHKVSYVLDFTRGRKIKRLFEFRDIEEQRDFVHREWNSPRWQKALSLVLNPMTSRFIIKDPGLNQFNDPSLNVGKYINERMNRSLLHSLACENPLVSLILRGKVGSEAYPPYLKKQGVEQISQRLDRVKTKTANVIDYLESLPPSSLDVFSLSDIASYIPLTDFDRLVRAIHRAARPGARFSIRQFLSNHHFPKDIAEAFERDHALESELEAEDLCFVYRFMVGKIHKG